MPNIHSLNSLRSSGNNASAAADNDHEEDRYVGGIDSRGGGSGLAVLPNNNHASSSSSSSDAIFNLAQTDDTDIHLPTSHSTNRTIITMYQSGFTVNDGPYRRLNDPNNSEFLTSLARGRIPRELVLLQQQANNNNDDKTIPEVTVGLIDRRHEEYDPERHDIRGSSSSTTSDSRGGMIRNEFQSFSGQGQSLGGGDTTTSSSISSSGCGIDVAKQQEENTTIFHPDNSSSIPPPPPPPLDPNLPSTTIAIRLLNGSRLVITINTTSPVSDIGQHIAYHHHHHSNQSGTGSASSSLPPYVLTSGYPPRIVQNISLSIEEAGLKGSQVVLKKV